VKKRLRFLADRGPAGGCSRSLEHKDVFDEILPIAAGKCLDLVLIITASNRAP
jgi:hypothetical protein